MAGYPESPLNPFYNAPILVREIKDHVTEQQLDAIENANAMRESAVKSLDAIAQALPRLNMTGVTPPAVPVFPTPRAQNLDLPILGNESFGSITVPDRNTFTVRPVAAIPKANLRDFDPVFDQLNIPDAPQERAIPEFPESPVSRQIDIPDAPHLNRPTLPNLVEVEIPSFSFSPLPAYNDENPEFIGSSVSDVLKWVEAPYTPVLMDEEISVLRRMWAGGTGLPPEVERSMWERAASREDVAAMRDISAAMVEFSGRGFTLPPGALVARVDAIRDEAALKKQSLGRDILIKVTDTQIENLRFACTQALAAENVLIGVWGQMAQRGLESAKIQLDAQLAILNANIAVYNAKQAGRERDIQVRRLLLEERNLELQTMKLELDGEIAKGTINEQRVRVYSEMYRGLQADVDLYKGELQGAQLISDLDRNDVEKYKAEVQALAEVIRADKNRYDAYESRVKGETAKAGLLESQARAYGAYVSGQSAIIDISIKNQNAELQKQELDLRAYLAQLESDKMLVQSQLSGISATAEAHRANTSRFVAQAQAETAIAEAEQRAWEAQVRNSVALYEVEMRKVLADMEQMIRSASLQLEGLKSIGQAYSTLAAGSMAGISLGASIGASAGTSASGSSSVSQTTG